MSARNDKPSRPWGSGVSLVEIMVALVIGLLLILGTVSIHSRTRAIYRSTEAVARLQETARYAFDMIEPDVRMASYWGLGSRSGHVVNRADPSQDTPAELAAAEAVIDRCGNNWAIDLDGYLTGWNGAAGFSLACSAYQDDHRAGTDGLIVRRGSETAAEALVGERLYIQGGRVQGTLFVADASCTDPKSAGCIPDGYPPDATETRELISTAYYVTASSVGRADVPALRRKRLATGAMLDEEVVSGVEDLQVRFGIDTDGDTNADSYVDPAADPDAYEGRIVAVTIWLRVRAEDAESGFTDHRVYRYADVDEAPGDGFRRIVVSKTISLRNRRS
jgi:type IV pilus assembly protein PilW